MAEQETIQERGPSPAAAPPASAEPVKILLVDDRPENLTALEAVLDALGQHLVRATSGREALRALLHDEFAVVLLDVQLPVMDGFEVAALIRAREQTQHLPIIFLTAIDKGDRQVAQGYALGAVDYLFKPFDPHILRAKVGVFIELSQQRRQIQRLNEDLEQRVVARTRELQEANDKLAREVAERKQAEAAVRELNTQLEQRVGERTRELEAANGDLRAFSYSVSHDLRAPLRRIEEFGRLLEEEHRARLGEDGLMCVTRLRAATRQMQDLIEDMLKLSQVASAEIFHEPVDLSALATQIIVELRHAAPERTVAVHIEEGLVATGDAGLLRLALQNLLSNAWKFTGRRDDATITFIAREQNDQCVYSVRDNGAGFDMALADRLFEPFHRLHGIREFPGTGVGLAIVARVIHRHGGQIWAESKPDEGATFSFTL